MKELTDNSILCPLKLRYMLNNKQPIQIYSVS